LKISGRELVSIFPWKMGIVAFMAFPELIKEEGFYEATSKIVEDEFFDIIEAQNYPEDEWKRAKELLESKDVEFRLALQLPILKNKLDLNSLDENTRRSVVKRLIDELEIAHSRGIVNAAICSGPMPPPDKVKESLRALKQTIVELIDYCKSVNMSLVIETFDQKYDKKLLLGGIDTAAGLIREIRKETGYDMGILWDLSHAPLLDEKPEVLKEYSDVVKHIHIGCAKETPEGLKDTHPVFYTRGAINDVDDVARLFTVLHEIGYKGAVTIEVKPEEHQTSLEIINTAKGVVLQAFTKALKKIIGFEYR